jgi:hypothetical protein
MRHGKNWKLVEAVVLTRSGTQIRSHAQKFFIRCEKEYAAKMKAEGRTVSRKEIKEEIEKLTSQGETSRLAPLVQEEQEDNSEGCPLVGLIRRESQKEGPLHIENVVAQIASETTSIDEHLRLTSLKGRAA